MVQPQEAAAQAVASPRPGPGPGDPPEDFEDFYLRAYRDLVRTAMYAGATPEEAEDAASKALEEMLPKWPVPRHPLQYARKAVISNFIKAKARGNLRITLRLIERAGPHREGTDDEQLAALENREWVEDVLSELPPAQREVMGCIADGLGNEEIADRLGISKDVVRRRLCDARKLLTAILNPDGEFKQPRRTTARSTREEAR